MNTPCSLLIYDEVLIGIFATNSLNVSCTFVKMFTYIYYRGRESDSNENARHRLPQYFFVRVYIRACIMHMNAYMHYAGTTNKKLCLKLELPLMILQLVTGYIS